MLLRPTLLGAMLRVRFASALVRTRFADGGDIGWVEKGQVDPEALDTIDSTPPGQLTRPIRTPSGFYIYGIRDKRELTDDYRKQLTAVIAAYAKGFV